LKVIRLYPPRVPKWLRWILYILLILILIPIIALLALQTSQVQNFIKNKAENYLEQKMGTQVSIGKIHISWFSRLDIEQVYLADKSGSALFYSGSLHLRYDLLELFNNRLLIRDINWDHVLLNAYSLPDGRMNYQFIMDAFAGDSTENVTKEATGKPMVFEIRNIRLTDLRLRYIDEKGGLGTVVKLGSLVVKANTIDPSGGIYDFREIRTTSLSGYFSQKYLPDIVTVAKNAADTNKQTLKIKAKLLFMKGSHFIYEDEGSGLTTGWKSEEASLKLASIDLGKTFVNTGIVSFTQPAGYVFFNPAKDTSTSKDSSVNSWTLVSPALNIKDGRFRLDDLSAPPIKFKHAFDNNHFFLNPVNISLKDVRYEPSGLKASLKELQVADKSGFMVKRGEADIIYSDTELSLNNLLLETNESRLSDQVRITVPSWNTIADQLPSMGIQAHLQQTRIVLADALFFVPQYRNDKNFKAIWNKIVLLDGELDGSLRSLQVKNLKFSDNVGNQFDLTGTVQHATDSKKIYADLTSLNIVSGDKPIRSWIPEGTIPSNIQIPAHMKASGSLGAGMNAVKTNLLFTSSFGDASISGTVNNFRDSLNSKYDLLIRSLNMDVGKWISDTSIGKIVAKGKIKGTGFAYKKMQTSADVVITSANYAGYDYRDISIKGNIDRGNYIADLISNDPNLSASVTIRGNINEGSPTMDGSVKLDRVDLQKLGLTTTPYIVKGDFDVNLKNSEPRKLNGIFYASHVQVSNDKGMYALDSIKITANDSAGVQYIRFDSPFGWANAIGDYDYRTVGNDMTRIIKHHIMAAGTDTAKQKISRQKMEFTASLRWPENLSGLVPGLIMNEPVTLNARINTDSNLVVIKGFLPSVIVDSIGIDSIQMNVLASTDSLYVDGGLAHFKHPDFPLNRTAIRAAAINGNMNWMIDLDGPKREPKYQLAGNIKFMPDNAYDIQLAPQIMLNKNYFETGNPNLISIRNNRLASANFQLVSDEQSIKFSTSAQEGTTLPPVIIKIDKFRISTITGFLATDTALAEGYINGDVKLNNLDKQPAVDAKLTIDSVQVTGAPLGNLAINLTTPAPDTYQADVKLSGNDNDVQINGTYSKELNFKVQLNKLNMASVQSFAMGEVTRLSGSANGNLTITGQPSQPAVRGDINFKEVKGNITFANTYVSLQSEKIVFDEQGILFNKFSIKDSLGGETNIDGRIFSSNYREFAFNLKINTDNFMVLGPKLNSDQEFYGPAFIDSKITVSGDKNIPKVEMIVKLRDKSQVTFVVPEDKPGVEDREGIILLVNKENPLDSSLLKLKEPTLVKEAKIKGIDFSGDVEITKTSTITIVVDQQNGDFLEAKGVANLNLTIDPSSKMTLTGKYDLEDGKYEMSLNQLIKRSFAIEKGSSITWNGDAVKADIDITAKHIVKAPAIDLIEDQITNSTTNKNQYKQRVPVEVFLMIKGQLMEPDITFRLDMAEKDRYLFNGIVYNRLKQINAIESELNKQVMGLLVLQKFISDNPLASITESGGSVEATARRSVSKVLSQQLNNLAGSLIKGVDLNFDLQSEEDYSTGSKSERTSLNIGASKAMFNDRLTVAVGSNIGIEGNPSGPASALIGDVTIDYALSKDGRYKLRAYQRNQTDAVLQGQIVETGLTFMLIMDYNKFKEIFRKTKEEQLSEKRKK
jgi:translocation and assembly module TamB